ncbi:hypothetical protein EDB19DRAFT_1839561, partial [Suillus lakei]
MKFEALCFLPVPKAQQKVPQAPTEAKGARSAPLASEREARLWLVPKAQRARARLRITGQPLGKHSRQLAWFPRISPKATWFALSSLNLDLETRVVLSRDFATCAVLFPTNALALRASFPLFPHHCSLCHISTLSQNLQNLFVFLHNPASTFVLDISVVLYRFSLLDNPLDRGPRTAFGPFLDRSLEFEGLRTCNQVLLPWPSVLAGVRWLFLDLCVRYSVEIWFGGALLRAESLILESAGTSSFTLGNICLELWNPSTPPTSPQRAQAAARQAERNQRNLGSPPARRHPNAPAVQPLLQNAPQMNIPQMLGNLNHGPIPMQRFPGLPRNVVEHHEAQ